MIKSVLLFVLAAAPTFAQNRIGPIEFFGYKGIDVAKVRAALTVQRGDEFNAGTKDSIRAAVMKAIGKEPTNVQRRLLQPARRIRAVHRPAG